MRYHRYGIVASRGDVWSEAVVVGLDSVTGLQTARILSRRGVPVVGVASDPSHPCCRTRACGKVLVSDTMGPGLIDTLAAVGPRLATKAVLVPCTDLSVLWIARQRDRLEPWFHVLLPPTPTVERLVDKARFHAWAVEEGLPVPRASLLRRRSDAEEAAESLTFPCVLKPPVKTREWRMHSAAKTHQADDPVHFLQLYDRLARYGGPLFAQEWIPGGDADHFTCNAYFDRDSQPLVAVATRKLRQWPPGSGEGCLSEHVDSPEVLGLTVRLFQAAGHHGLAYLETKRHASTRRHLIIEPNIGRPTGRSANVEAAGAELLYTMYCDAIGAPLPASRRPSRPGAKWIHRRRELQSALRQVRSGDLTVTEWWRQRRGPKVDALFSWRDPMPFWADLGRVGRRALHQRQSSLLRLPESNES